MAFSRLGKMTFTYQLDQMDCGPACLSMVASSFGKNYSLQFLRNNSFITREGVSLIGLKEASEKIGFQTVSAKLNLSDLKNRGRLFPCILHWNKNHFVVLLDIKIKRKFLFFGTQKTYFKIADPAHGIITLKEESFNKSWLSDYDDGIVMFFSPTEHFYELTEPVEPKINLRFVVSYLKPFRKQVSFMLCMLFMGSAITLVFPFLTQNLIDRGINKKDVNFITIILLAQLGLYIGSLTIEIVRNWLMLIIGTRISILIISDFLKKLLQLPIKFFDTKMMGDFNQRIKDNEKIDTFLTSQGLLTLFSIITFSVFLGILWHYDVKILAIYLILTILAICWSYYWLRKRKILDYQRFQNRSENQESISEILGGITEMKLNQFEDYKRTQWEKIQEKLYKINVRILKLDQNQVSGFEFINQLKNILVTYMAALYVVEGSMSLGELLGVSYIIGQMNAPVNQLINFFRSLQEAKLSLERLNEVQYHDSEETDNNRALLTKYTSGSSDAENGIRCVNLSFQYNGPKSDYVLKNINLSVPDGKVTAIVGASGSGKTTLLKLLLKFYEATDGEIFYDRDNINMISPKSLRSNCGVVMQDGYIFSDTIKRNIATGDEEVDLNKLTYAAKIANIESFINGLPLKYNTKIGASGNGISGGQKQRILIARSVYRNPKYIFFDEATSALDSENEKVIHNNLQHFFHGRTVLIVAHRLSTVKNADNIIVLREGEIVETGTHDQLVSDRNYYFNLVKNQLELGIT